MPEPALLVVMGVSGSGKSTVGALLAERLGVPFADADAFHPQANIAKMASGHPLTDVDRQPWLDAIDAWLHDRTAAGRGGVVTCSALKRRYRDRLRTGRPALRFIYLRCSRGLLAARLAARRGHFFKQAMLDSQLTDLEEPTPGEHAVVVSIDATPHAIVDAILGHLEAGR